MATSLVNLDALIQRDDFLVAGGGAMEGSKTKTLKINDLESGSFFFNSLRKPDFQRETANWTPAKIQDFVRTFLEGDLIPAVICWSAGGSNVFIIDGAHRLSALIAWVSDDYGDGVLSREFFHNAIPAEQVKAAERTRKQINSSIGTYLEHKNATKHPETRQEVKDRAIRLGSFSIDVQWVPSADAKRAEAAFFKINQAATPIDPTELRILNARFSPVAITARVIMRNATGHKYWGKFNQDNQKQVEEIGKEIYKNLFLPPINTPIKTLDLPVAGRGYSGQTLPLIFDFVNIANGLTVIDLTKTNMKAEENKDEDGSETVKALKRTQTLTQRITGIHPSSLGLHPAVYFYSATGRYQPTAFLAMASLITDLEKEQNFGRFTKLRSQLEDFLLNHKNFINQITTKFGSGAKGFSQVKALYSLLLDSLDDNIPEDKIVGALKGHKIFNFLKPFSSDEAAPKEASKFSKATKSATFLSEALATAIRCNICNGLMHFNSIQVDHIVKRSDGGLAVKSNAQLSHPYCNSTIKG